MNSETPVSGRTRRRPRSRAYPAIGAQRPQRPNRARLEGGATPPRLEGRLSAEELASLRTRLLDVIRNATGADGQCHLSVAIMSERARADRRLIVRELAILRSESVISRFLRENGQTATVILPSDQ